VLIYARAPSLLDNIRSRARQLSSKWAGDDVHVDKQHNAQQSAPQPGSALSSANPPGWRPAALDHESSNSVLIEALTDPISSKNAISPGTAAGAGDSGDSNDVTFPGTAAGAVDFAEETQMRTTTTDLSCLLNRGIAGAQGVCEPTGSAGSQTSPKVSSVYEPAESSQNTSKSTLTRISNTCDALDAARCERDTLGTNPGDVNEGQRVYARGTSSAIKTRTTYEGGDGDKYQEAEGGDEEEEREERNRMSESDQEHEAGSEDEDEHDDAGDGEDEEENDEKTIRKTMTRKGEV
jgi:hypothetical protein